MSTKRAERTTPVLPASFGDLPPIPEPFASLFEGVLIEKDRRDLRATGMTDEEEIEFLDRIVLDALWDLCAEEYKKGERARKRAATKRAAAKGRKGKTP